MVSVLILSFITGLLLTSGLPHFIQGASGHKHQTPFAKSSSAAVNVVFGWACFVLAALVWHVAPMHQHPRAAFSGLMVGLLVMGLALTQIFDKKSAK